MSSQKKKRRPSLLDHLLGAEPEDKPQEEKKPERVEFVPAMRQIGTTDCPVCKHEVAVFLTRTKRPFVNCGFCSARIFYNGRESIRRLKRKMEVVDGE